MTRADLLRGDSPWRLDVVTDRRGAHSARERLCALAAVTVLLSAALVSTTLLCAVAGVVALWWWRPSLYLVGGGRQPLSSSEWLGWCAHLDLLAQDQKRAAKRRG